MALKTMSFRQNCKVYFLHRFVAWVPIGGASQASAPWVLGSKIVLIYSILNT
jgi:hypothetical protein